MNYPMTEEQSMFLDSLRSFLEQEIYPHEAECDRLAVVPEELGLRIKHKAIEMGFFAANLPEEVGGGGLDYSTLGLFERELGKVSYGLGGHLARPTELLLACEGEQIDRYLKPCISGEKHESFALTEPGAGSDIMSMSTRAVADGDDYVINGMKHFISTPVVPDFAILFAVTGTDDTPRGERKRVTAFLVDVAEPGWEHRAVAKRNDCWSWPPSGPQPVANSANLSSRRTGLSPPPANWRLLCRCDRCPRSFAHWRDSLAFSTHCTWRSGWRPVRTW